MPFRVISSCHWGHKIIWQICTLPMTLMVSVSVMIGICDPYVYVPLGSFLLSLVHIGVMTLMVTLQ